MELTKREQVLLAVENHWNSVMPSYRGTLLYDDMQEFVDDWVDDVAVSSDENFSDGDISLGFQRTVLKHLGIGV